MACEENMYRANEAMELILQYYTDEKELTEREAETDSKSEDEEEDIGYIEPFLNKRVANFQAAYYPYQDVSIDEMKRMLEI